MAYRNMTVSGGRKDEWTTDDERLKLSTKVTGDRSKMEKKKAVGCSGCSGASGTNGAQQDRWNEYSR